MLVPAERFELPTNGLQNRCSTTELSRHRQDRQGGIRALRASARLPHRNGPGRAPACCNRQDAPGEAPERLPQGSFRVSALSAELAVGRGAVRGAGRSFASFRRGRRATLSFTGGGGGLSTQWDHAKYARFANTSARKTFRTGRF